jgi:hypothetical protein
MASPPPERGRREAAEEEASGMAEKRDQAIERREAERRELEAAGWEPKGNGAKTIWRSPADGRFYAHYQAVKMQRKENPPPEEERLLREHGFERATTVDRERWERLEEGLQRRYTRSQALVKARREGS